MLDKVSAKELAKNEFNVNHIVKMIIAIGTYVFIVLHRFYVSIVKKILDKKKLGLNIQQVKTAIKLQENN